LFVAAAAAAVVVVVLLSPWRDTLPPRQVAPPHAERLTLAAPPQQVSVSMATKYNVSQPLKTAQCFENMCRLYFLNNSVKHWPILIIFGVPHHEETWRRKRL